MSETTARTAPRGRLKGRVAVVTGGASGTGAAICREFAAEGARVVAVDRNGAALKAFAQALRSELPEAPLWTREADITRSASVGEMARFCSAEVGEVDILVNNAGVRLLKPFWEHSDEDWQQMLDVNLSGHFYCARELVGPMVQRGWGRIINITSIGGIVGRPHRAAYCAAKAGLAGLTKALASDLRHTGVTVNAVAPGSIATPLNAKAANDKDSGWDRETLAGRWGNGRDIAAACVYLASDDASYVNATSLTVDGGWVSVKDRGGEMA